MKKLILAMLVSLALLTGAVANEKLMCGLTAQVLMARIDETRMTVMISLTAECPDRETKIYESRQAALDVGTPKEIGALVLRMMAQEISDAMKADNISGPISADDILEHAELKTVEP